MKEIAVFILLILGTLLILLAGIGIIRMPDLYMRMSATTKAATLGTGFMLGAAALHFQDTSITARCFTAIVFLLLTAPVAAHVLGRAAYFIGIPMWKKSKKDELKGKYNYFSHILTSEDSSNLDKEHFNIKDDDKKSPKE
ncbi:monovalent cation/H(+) antiporter subunit G [Cytophagaceae bacterium ABcell3]|nr:monovalent cation/H(+) antiporter subunit G [Cytophagaceae bacterium ABcell3]